MNAENVVRVVKGDASDEELAALTAVLLARAAARPQPPAAEQRRRAGSARWQRLERRHGFRTAHSWQE
ncbi:acyl-CoA carboxylase epsilon subunit [Streptomyces sp. NPDC020192]|uniref:acyl-CoA carboxylase epsilon subunit n=1 Tax=Streptomyces sp. NPDC020192 TaxID=3365066 RepID=UPI00378D2E8D